MAAPERAQHCTHPAQAWCDCDWCRYLRAYREGRCQDGYLLAHVQCIPQPDGSRRHPPVEELR